MQINIIFVKVEFLFNCNNMGYNNQNAYKCIFIGKKLIRQVNLCIGQFSEQLFCLV